MGLLGQLRETLNAHRKRKQQSIDGTVAGVSYNHYHRGYNRGAFDGPIAISTSRPTEAYEPDPGPMEIRGPDYEPYECEVSSRSTPPFRMPLPEWTEPGEASPPDYDACPMTDALLAWVIQELTGATDAAERLSCDAEALTQRAARGAGSLDELVTGQVILDPGHEIGQAFDELMRQDDVLAHEASCDSAHYVLHDDYMRQHQDELNQLMDSMWNAHPPATQPDPLQEQQPYHEQLRMLMDPFGMMGPMGFGPMM